MIQRQVTDHLFKARDAGYSLNSAQDHAPLAYSVIRHQTEHFTKAMGAGSGHNYLAAMPECKSGQIYI